MPCRATKSRSWTKSGTKFQTARKGSCGFVVPRRPPATTAIPKRPKRCCRATRQQRFGRFGIAVVAGGRRGTTKPQEPFRAVWNFVPDFVHDRDFVARQGISGRYKCDCRFVLARRGHRASLRRECLALHTIDQWAAIQRRDGDPKSSLRQAVDGELGFAAKAVTCETLRKAFERLRIHRLRAIQRRAPGTEVDTLDVFVGDLAHAKFISKIRRGGDRAAMFVKRLQPALGARQKNQRRHHHQWYSEIQQ